MFLNDKYLAMRLFEFEKSSTKISKLNEFVKWACKKINIKDCPIVKYGTSLDKVKKVRTFGSTTSDGDIWVHIKNRNLADICRTLMHELIHHKQFETGTASDDMDDKQLQRIEDEANAYAGRLMRDYGKIHKDIYENTNVKNAENDAAFIGYLSPNEKFECYSESEAKEFITEGASSILYHYTSVSSAAKILRNHVFKLSNSAGNDSEASYAPRGYPYFLSTSRTRVGDYQHFVSTSGVTFVLNGTWFGSRYPVKPIDYWERSWEHSNGTRTRESEDRVFSKKSEISLDGVTAIHVLLKEQSESSSPSARFILIQAKLQGIPAYLYSDENAWRLQTTSKSISVAQSDDLLTGQAQTRHTPRPMRGVAGYGRNSLLDWIELIAKKPGQSLSKTADKLAYNIRYYGDHAAQLKNDLFNAKTPNANNYELAVKITNYLNQQKLDIQGLMDQLKTKWANPST